MIKPIPMARIHKLIPHRWDSYLAEMMACGTLSKDGKILSIPLVSKCWRDIYEKITHHEAIKPRDRRPTPPKPMPVPKPDRTAACVHRGEEIREEKCETCSGSVRIKVFRCSIYTECTVKKAVGVQVCETCKDYSPAK